MVSFSQNFEKKVLRTIREFSMIRPHQKIAVGLSGGTDSITLLYFLSNLRKKLPMDLVAITVDNNLGDEYTKSIFVNAQKLAKKLDIPYYKISFKEYIGKTLEEISVEKNTKRLCTYCGVLRRRILNSASHELGADKLAIGHNLNDTCEMYMLNIIRNEPERLVRYVKPIINHKSLVPRIRPFMAVSKSDIQHYADIHRLKYFVGRCPYAKYSLRFATRTSINEWEEKFPGTMNKMYKSMLKLINLYSKNITKFELRQCKYCGEISSTDVCTVCRLFGPTDVHLNIKME